MVLFKIEFNFTFPWCYSEEWKNYRLVSWWRTSRKMRNFLEEIWRGGFSERMVGGGRTRSHYHWIKIQIFWKKLSWDNWTLHLSSSSIISEVSQYLKKRSVQFLISEFSSKYFLLWFKMFFITFTEYWTWARQSSIFHQPFRGSDSSFTTETFFRLGKTWWISSIVFTSSATISSTLKSLPETIPVRTTF